MNFSRSNTTATGKSPRRWVSGRLLGIVVSIATWGITILSLPGCQKDSKDAVLEIDVESFSLGQNGANPTLALAVTLLASNQNKSTYCTPPWYGTGEARPEWADLNCRAKDFVFKFSSDSGFHKSLGIRKGQEFDGLIWAWVEVFWIPQIQDDKPKLIYRNILVLDHADLTHRVLHVKKTDLCIPASTGPILNAQIPQCPDSMDPAPPYECLTEGKSWTSQVVPDTMNANVDQGWCVSGQDFFGACHTETNSCGRGGCEPETGEDPKTCPQDCGIAKLVAGAAHNCVLTFMGEVFCWGDNSAGQCGAAPTTKKFASPHKVPFSDDVPITSLAAGGQHTCALDKRGSLWCWGDNQQGQLGTGSADDFSSNPQKVASLQNVRQIAAGAAHTCARTQAGNLFCWGNNQDGQIGQNSTTPSSMETPQEVNGTWSAVWAGGNHTCAVNATDGLFCWGANDKGQIGNGQSGTAVPSPSQVAFPGTPSIASLGQAFTCAWKDNTGPLYCWGANDACQLGLENTGPDKSSPTKVPDISALLDLSSGGAHSCYTSQGDGQNGQTLCCWGGNSMGQTGQQGPNANPTCYQSEVTLGGMPIDVAAGLAHTCALAQVDGNSPAQVVWCWGDNHRNQLGADSPATSATPIEVHWH